MSKNAEASRVALGTSREQQLEIELIHLRADMEEMRAWSRNVLVAEISQLENVLVALSRTPPKVETSCAIIEASLDAMRRQRDKLDRT